MSLAATAGIGLRHPHHAEMLERRPALGFVEVHSENFFADGGAALAMLHAARECWPVSLHGVGLGLGSAAGIDGWHLDRLARLVERIEPAHVSDHACFARAPRRAQLPASIVHANDLLPVAFTEGALEIMVSNVQQVQERLRRPILVENLSAYLHWADDALAEPEFFNRLAQRSGCALLLDVNNLVVNALNEHTLAMGALPGPEGIADVPEVAAAAARAACAWVDAIEPAHVAEIHLAGYCDTGEIVIDDHGSQVHAPVWQVYRHALRRLGPRPTLVEWDTGLPALDVLLGEAAQADAVLAQHARAAAEALA